MRNGESFNYSIEKCECCDGRGYNTRRTREGSEVEQCHVCGGARMFEVERKTITKVKPLKRFGEVQNELT